MVGFVWPNLTRRFTNFLISRLVKMKMAQSLRTSWPLLLIKWKYAKEGNLKLDFVYK